MLNLLPTFTATGYARRCGAGTAVLALVFVAVGDGLVSRYRPPLATRRPSTTTRQDRTLAGSGCDTGGLAALPPAPTPFSTATSAATSPRPPRRTQSLDPRGRAPPVFHGGQDCNADRLRPCGDRSARCPPGAGSRERFVVPRTSMNGQIAMRRAKPIATGGVGLAVGGGGEVTTSFNGLALPDGGELPRGRSPPVRVDVSNAAGVDVQRGMSAGADRFLFPERLALSGGTSGRAPCGTV